MSVDHRIVDAHEKQRTAALRECMKYALLLEDGIHAIQHGSIGVAEEYMIRTHAALQRMTTTLQLSDDLLKMYRGE